MGAFPAARDAAAMSKPLVVLCGSMTHYRRMLALKAELEARGILVVAPADERELAQASVAERVRYKRRISESYFRIIRRRAVSAILVVNLPKHGRKNYIGPNSFAEIAIALNARKPIFLLRGIYPPLRDELIAWDAVPLRGNLALLAKALKAKR